jgi:hypothetical protein
MPILMPWEWLADGSPWRERLFKETAAHEFGHSVLRDERDHDWSITHKGSTGGALDQNPKPTQPSYPTSGEIDLMKYWNKPDVDDEFERSIVAEDEARGLVSIAQVELSTR